MSNSTSPVPQHHRTLQMSVANMTFMVDRLGADCAPAQFIRELTQNALAAVSALPAARGEVTWDVDWNTFALTGIYKLCVIDTGIGMTGPEMVEYINKLSSSVHVQSNVTNFGVGAKISAAPHNKAGIIYMSWKDGRGSIVHLWRDPATDVYGLKQFERPDGSFDYWAYVDDAVKPEPITSHGTMVVLLGNSDEQNTVDPPPGVAMPAKWVLRYLNGRYFEFPAGITVRAREGYALPRGDKHNFLRQAEGMRPWLERSAESAGTVALSGATARWWIMRPDADLNSGHFTPPGHVGAIFQNEIYDLTAGRAGVARLQSFGVIFGHSRVVVYIEPDPTAARVEPNTARTTLSMNSEPLPWSEWAAEFRSVLPNEIRTLVEEVGARSASGDYRQAIRERLKSIMELFRLTRYRPSRSGHLTVDASSMIAGGAARARDDEPKDQGGERGGRGGRGGSIYGLFLATAGANADEVQAHGEPDRKWVTVRDGTRTPGDMDDRAAKFIPQQNLLLINEDFRVFEDMMAHWTEKYSHAAGAAVAVRDVVHEWFEQQLVEAIIGAQNLRDSRQWTMVDLEQLWSPEALTAVVVPKYHVNLAIGRALGARVGSLRTVHQQTIE